MISKTLYATLILNSQFLILNLQCSILNSRFYSCILLLFTQNNPLFTSTKLIV